MAIARIPDPPASWAPACMSIDELAFWEDANRRVPKLLRAVTPCEDCPATWRRQVRREGRCNRSPKCPCCGHSPAESHR